MRRETARESSVCFGMPIRIHIYAKWSDVSLGDAAFDAVTLRNSSDFLMLGTKLRTLLSVVGRICWLEGLLFRAEIALAQCSFASVL